MHAQRLVSLAVWRSEVQERYFALYKRQLGEHVTQRCSLKGKMNKQEGIWEDGQEAGVAGGLAKKTLVGSEVRGNGPGRSPEAVRFGFSRPRGVGD